jgi:hypothetical protein
MMEVPMRGRDYRREEGSKGEPRAVSEPVQEGRDVAVLWLQEATNSLPRSAQAGVWPASPPRLGSTPLVCESHSVKAGLAEEEEVVRSSFLVSAIMSFLS